MPLPLQLVVANEPHWKRGVRFKWWGDRDVMVAVELVHTNWRRLDMRSLRVWVRIARWRTKAEVVSWEQAHLG